MGIENQLSATRTTNMSGLNPTARVASRRYCKTALPSLFFIPLSRQAHRVTIVYLNSLLIIKEATRKLPKEWHLKSDRHGLVGLAQSVLYSPSRKRGETTSTSVTYLSSVSASRYALSVKKAISPRSARKITQPRNVENEKMRCRTKTAVNSRLD